MATLTAQQATDTLGSKAVACKAAQIRMDKKLNEQLSHLSLEEKSVALTNIIQSMDGFWSFTHRVVFSAISEDSYNQTQVDNGLAYIDATYFKQCMER